METKQGSGRKLTDDQKAEIAVLKDTRPTATSTNKNIAKEFEVSMDLVNRINYTALSEEQKQIYNRKRDDLKYLAQNLTYNAMQEANSRVLNGQGKLSEVVGAMKIANDIYRLETGQSTQNINDSLALTAIAQFRREVLDDLGAALDYLREYGPGLGISGEVIEVTCKKLGEGKE
jgi:hypothetical protein